MAQANGEKGDDVWLRAQSSWLPPYKVRSVVASPSEHHSLSSRGTLSNQLQEELPYATWSDKNNS
ncbi:hypothetical protein E2C01_068035 [Portunus trituberculatus]|uniref:Uncharacterized protein n=1 Tax=Portunus trituberculatus TaxID=210409 RepID=A0A5B7HVB0_PORTR|nr:hypothetical protein [Portunus trituberculatus]